jgi:hypothetical protein
MEEQLQTVCHVYHHPPLLFHQPEVVLAYVMMDTIPTRPVRHAAHVIQAVTSEVLISHVPPVKVMQPLTGQLANAILGSLNLHMPDSEIVASQPELLVATQQPV